MKSILVPSLSALALMASGAFAQFDTALAWGDAGTDANPDGVNGRSSGTLTNPVAGTYEITSGGADFWGTSDAGTVIYDSSGSYTTTGDLTATVRHVMTSPDNAANWGRAMISARLTEGNTAAGVPEANDAHFGTYRRSNGGAALGTIRRASDGGDTRRATTRNGNMGENLESDSQDQMQNVGFEYESSVYMAVGRNGNEWWTGFATDLGGSPGRWVSHYAIEAGNGASAMSNPVTQAFQPLTGANATRDNVGIAVGDEVTVVLGHQAHNEGGVLAGANNTGNNGGGRVNTAVLDQYTYQNSFDPSFFNPVASNTTWQVDGSISVSAGEITGSAFVRDFINNGGNATGEAVKWEVTAHNLSSFVPAEGSAGSHKDPNAMEGADLVPASSFRYDSDGMGAYMPGLFADLYTETENPGNQANAFNIINNSAPDGTAIIPDINWNGGSDNDNNYNGLSGPASFAVAVQGVDPADGTNAGNGTFSENENNFGVDHRGEIFIPANGGKQDLIEQITGDEYVLFEDGVDDYTYLEIDGVVIIDDNQWTGTNATQNGGGHVGLLDVSDPKYDDGEWVSFRMITWEGGGGDNGRLYWDANDANDSFDVLQTPGTFTVPSVTASGITQVGDENSSGSFGANLSAGDWAVILDVSNTGTSARFTDILNVTDGAPDFAITAMTYNEGAQTIDLTWRSQPNFTYGIDASTTLESNVPANPGDWEEIDDSIPSGGTSTTRNGVAIPAHLQGPHLNIRVRRE